jgi:cytochrome P450
VVLTAQAAMFLRAGSEKASTTISFCLNELALQPKLQSELRTEIEAAKEEHGGKLTYEIVLGLKLLDRVVSGTCVWHDYVTWEAIYEQRNIVALLRKYCCRGKAISIIYYEFVFLP